MSTFRGVPLPPIRYGNEIVFPGGRTVRMTWRQRLLWWLGKRPVIR